MGVGRHTLLEVADGMQPLASVVRAAVPLRPGAFRRRHELRCVCLLDLHNSEPLLVLVVSVGEALHYGPIPWPVVTTGGPLACEWIPTPSLRQSIQVSSPGRAH